MNYRYDIYNLSTPGKPIFVASKLTQSEALETIAALKIKSPDSRFVVKPEYNVPVVSS